LRSLGFNLYSVNSDCWAGNQRLLRFWDTTEGDANLHRWTSILSLYLSWLVHADVNHGLTILGGHVLDEELVALGRCLVVACFGTLLEDSDILVIDLDGPLLEEFAGLPNGWEALI
jgi:hypothetical protein